MKKLMVTCLTAILLLQAVNGQDDKILRASEFGFSIDMFDFETARLIRNSSLSTVIRNKTFAKGRYFEPGFSLHYYRGVREHIDLAGTLTAGFVNYPLNKPQLSGSDILLALDASGQFKMVSEAYWLQPFLSAGLGVHKYHKYYGAFMPLGVGLNLDLMSESKLVFQYQYRVPVTNETSEYHFFYSLGITGRIGPKREPQMKPPPPPPPPQDSDGDGITDDKDKCPTTPGVAKYDGCPVPDTDKDGINDDNDKCPDVPGLAKYQGCPVPDTDKDGINDEEDKCPDQPGVARYQGCPVPDRDGDGVNDENDKCPDEPGTAANQGCPEISQEVTKTVSYAAKNVYFATNSARLLSKSFAPLDELAKVMNDNPSLQLKIDGHTDNTGAEDYNMTLSDRRAESVKKYLVSKGVDAGRMVSEGFGESAPVADNNTAAGRQQNRRVEMKVHY